MRMREKTIWANVEERKLQLDFILHMNKSLQGSFFDTLIGNHKQEWMKVDTHMMKCPSSIHSLSELVNFAEAEVN